MINKPYEGDNPPKHTPTKPTDPQPQPAEGDNPPKK